MRRRRMGRQAESIYVPQVTIAITTFNHGRFLAAAIESALAQTTRAHQVIVVDDGSDDDPHAIVRDYSGVEFRRQANRGLASARNAALAAATGEYITFLDADDLLLPDAIAEGLACWTRAGKAAFVYGAHRRIAGDGGVIAPYCYSAVETDARAQLLRGNGIGMHAAVLYDAAILRSIGGFDEALRRCEDYDVYLRLAVDHPIASHACTVADYRWHGGNMSGDHRAMCASALAVLDRHRPPNGTSLRGAWRQGRARWRAYYAAEALRAALQSRNVAPAARAAALALRTPPVALLRELCRRRQWLAGDRG